MSRAFHRTWMGAATAALACALMASVLARALPLSVIRVPLGPVGLGPRSFASARLPLPVESTGRPVRLRLRASADVRSALVVHLAGARVSELVIRAGEPDLYVLEIPTPASGQPLDLAFAVWLRSRGGEAPAPEPLVVVRELEIESSGGLVFRPGACLLLGAWPLAALGVAWLGRLAPGRALVGSVLAAGIAVLGSRFVPLELASVSPYVIAAGLAAGLASRLPLAPGPECRRGEGLAGGWIWAAGLAALPALETSLLLAALFGRTLADHVPGFVNDAIDYWLEAQAFAHAGLRGGYFTVDERPAPASFSHFGSHGPFFPMLHGALGRVLGWHPYSIPVFHLGFLAAALLILARRTPLDSRGRALTALCLATFWPLLFLIPTSMQEGLHFAVAVLLAAALRPLLAGREASRALRAGLLAALVLASLIRPSWGLLLPPAFLLLLGAASGKRRALAAAVGVGLWAVLVAVYGVTAAPYGRHEFFFLKVVQLEEGVPALFAQAAMNAKRFVTTGSSLDLRNRFLVIALALSCSALAWRTRPRREMAFHAYNLAFILLASLFTYVVGAGNDLRVLSPHLLLTLLLLATSPATVGRRLAAFVLLVQLGSQGPFLQSYRQLRETFTYDAARIHAFGVAARRVMTFDARRDPWCNTLVSVNFPYFYPEMLGLPPGMGVTMLLGSSPAGAPRSRYLLLDPGGPRLPSVGNLTVTPLGPDRVRVRVGDWLWPRLEPLASTPLGQLYRNVDGACPEG